MKPPKARPGRIRAGFGGWTYEPWRDTFYPPDLPQKRELEYASRQVTAIEINGTYYRTQNAASFRKWHDETPADFVFSVKAPRYATNRKVLAEAGASIDYFMASGLESGEAKREADEFLDLHPMPLSRALQLIEAGEIQDAKTALGLLFSAGFRAGR